MKKLLTLFLLTLTVFTTSAQKKQDPTHADASKYNCHVNSFVWGELPLCPTCKKKEEADKAKKQAAQKIVEQKAKLLSDEKAKKSAEWFAKQKAISKQKSTEVTYSMPKTVAQKGVQSTKTLNRIAEARKYGTEIIYITPYSLELRETFNSYKKTIKILYNKKVTYSSSDYYWIKQVSGRNSAMFVREETSTLSRCKAEHSNRSVLINPLGKIINLPGIDKFGFETFDRDNSDNFIIVVYTGECSIVNGGTEWYTMRYTFSYTTMQLVSSEKSWQYSEDCKCD